MMFGRGMGFGFGWLMIARVPAVVVFVVTALAIALDAGFVGLVTLMIYAVAARALPMFVDRRLRSTPSSRETVRIPVRAAACAPGGSAERAAGDVRCMIGRLWMCPGREGRAIRSY